MLMPENWRVVPENEAYTLADGTVIGDDPAGKTVAVHSVVVVPEFQGRGVGKELVGAYVEYIRGLGLGFERVVLIAHDHLIRFYEGVGFVNFGVGKCLFAGGGWNDLVSLYASSSVCVWVVLMESRGWSFRTESKDASTYRVY